ncbi:MAG TPA: hypothetical protein VME46_10840, partial [Acidimicrobiales bacterium]|nr:hypothetical protein [Acidimicrobiales bacterium]
MSAVVAAVGRELSRETSDWAREALDMAGASGSDGTSLWESESCLIGQALLRVAGNEEPGLVVVSRRRDLPARRPSFPEGRPPGTDDDLVLAGEARLDDRSSLVRQLRSRGCDVAGATSDLRLVACSYREWGDTCLDHVRGDFAFVLWDPARHRLLCARDQLGAVPLHYARVGAELLVA